MKKVFFLLLISITAKGQQYAAEAPLNKVLRSGFYSIPLTPRVTSMLEPDYRNIRIVDENNKEAPYVIKTEKPKFSNQEFVEYEMKKEQVKGCCTTITLVNGKKDQISNIIFEVRNAETSKEATLLGSDDKETWYALKERFTIDNIASETETSELRILDFPLSDYSFYRVIINDSTTASLNIIKGGYYNVSTDYGVYVDVPNVSVSSTEDIKKHVSEIVIRFDTTQFVDRVELSISGPKFYHRRAELFDDRKHLVKTFDITSTHSTTIDNSIRSKQLTLFVSNDDNQPLNFGEARAYQLKRSLSTWLTDKHRYRLVIGGDSMQAPVYDLEYFRDSIPPSLDEVNIEMVRNLERLKQDADPTFLSTPRIIWLVITFVGALLGLMSYRMLRDKEK